MSVLVLFRTATISMFGSIWDDIKQQFSYGNTLTRIILVNVGVFVALTLVRVFLKPAMGESAWYRKWARLPTPVT